MKRMFIPLMAVYVLILLPVQIAVAQNDVKKQQQTLTHHMSPYEEALKHLIGKDFKATDPPPGPVRNIAEFEAMQGVLIRFPFGISLELIAALSEETTVTTIVSNQNEQNDVTNQYQANGVNLANCNFLLAPSDSHWTRDYGPWYIAYGTDSIGIVDFIYNRPNRPNDNAIPIRMANFLGVEYFGMDLIHTGGNYMTDGWGISSSSDLVWEENPSLTQAQIDQMVLDYLGVNTYHVIPDPNNTYIDHIDCWGKFLDVDKVLIREVPASHPQYDEIEATAAYYASQTSAYGHPYQVFRVYTPNDQPYTNSLIVNDRIFLPIMNSQWDDEAIAAYEAAMPGYEVLGFTGSWESTDALHCRVKGTADVNMLYIEHMPLLGDQPVQNDYAIEAEITAYSDATVIDDSVMVYYSINGGNFEHLAMSPQGAGLYTATLPGGPVGTEIAYFLYAADEAGKRNKHPFIGEPDPHVFYSGEQLLPDIHVDVTEVEATAPAGTSVTENFNILNQGQFQLHFDMDWTTAVFEEYQYQAPQSPAQNAWQYNTYTELGWTEIVVTDMVDISGWQIDFIWNTDNWPEEGSFHIESPSGTQAVIASGIPDGFYTVNLDDFNGESTEGTWILWIEDTYGDGGHQAGNIGITVTTQLNIPDWMTVTPVSGALEPGNQQTVDVLCDATGLGPGGYEGSITIISNDPDQPEIILPVHFNVELPSLVNSSYGSPEMDLIAAPNPFSIRTVIEASLPGSAGITVEVFDLSGKKIRALADGIYPEGLHQFQWDGARQNGRKAEAGIYLIRMTAGNSATYLKVVKN